MASKECGCIPSELGYYRATYKRWPDRREIVLLAKDGFKHVRAFTCRFSSSHDPCDFTDYSARLKERKRV